MNVIEGSLTAPKGRFALVAARFNHLIVDSLVAGARDALLRHGVADSDIVIVHVPGSLEIALVAQNLAASKKYVAVVCLPPSSAATRRTTITSPAPRPARHRPGEFVDLGVPVIFGILTCDTVEQALNRAGLKAGNKGFEAAAVAIEMANLVVKL